METTLKSYNITFEYNKREQQPVTLYFRGHNPREAAATLKDALLDKNITILRMEEVIQIHKSDWI
jgi:hypothetical protein